MFTISGIVNVYKKFTIHRKFTKSLQFVQNRARPPALGIYRKFTVCSQFRDAKCSQFIHNLVTKSLQIVYNFLKASRTGRARDDEELGVSLSPTEFFFDLSTQLSQGGGFRDFSGENWKIVFLTNTQS